MQLAGCCLLAGAGYGAGALRLREVSRRTRTLHQLERLCVRVREEIAYRSLPLEEILQLLRGEPGFELLELAQCDNLQGLVLPGTLARSQRDALENALSALGRRTGPESCQLLEYCCRLCRGFAQEEQEALHTARHLYRQLGFCAGLLAGVLLL